MVFDHLLTQTGFSACRRNRSLKQTLINGPPNFLPQKNSTGFTA